MSDETEWWLVRDVARRFGVDRCTAWRWINEGLLDAYRIGGRIMVKESDVQAFIASNRVVPRAKRAA